MGVVQELWDSVVNVAGSDSFTYRVLGTHIFTQSVYFGIGAIFIFFDLTLSPKALRKYKSQLKANEPMDMNKFKTMMKLVLFNNLFVGSIMTYIGYLVQLKVNGPDTEQSLRTLPSLSTFVWQFAVFLLIEETMFFYSHWLLHQRYFYKHIHKKHHEWTAPISYAATYAHPVEHLISNLLPPSVGPILVNCHITTMWIWYGSVIVQTLFDHSGYHLPFLPSNEMHDYHHLKFNQNYGTNLGVWDWFHGTDKIWRERGTFKRHRVLLGTASARELYPCETDKAEISNGLNGVNGCTEDIKKRN